MEKRFNRAEREDTKSFEVVLIQDTKGLDMLKGAEGAECFQPFKGGGGHTKFYPVSRGAQKVSHTQFSHSVSPPPCNQ